jgi:hypothetical protein
MRVASFRSEWRATGQKKPSRPKAQFGGLSLSLSLSLFLFFSSVPRYFILLSRSHA